MQKKKVPLGTSDFKTIISEDRYFVDKSLFIKDVVDGSEVILFTRPRRFGKTLNLSMLSYFYGNKEDNADLFTNLEISKEPEIMAKQGKHPVIYLTFKDIKPKTWEACSHKLFATIYSLIKSFKTILCSEVMEDIDIKCCQKILADTANLTDYEDSIKKLSEALYHYYKVKPVILIDEYDMPIQYGYSYNYNDDIIDFMRNFLGGALKDNYYLEKAVLTGILRIAKESVFSGLNNLEVCTICKLRAADKFGFTEGEVAELLKYYDNMFSLDEIKYWYDGYNFSGAEIYNPWSILSSINEKQLARHWVNTSDNNLIKELCLQAGETVKQDIDILSLQGSLQKVIDDNIIFKDLGKDDDAIWSFLLHAGYLRYDNFYIEEYGAYKADLSIPNYEVLGLFLQDIAKKWLTPQYNPHILTKITKNLINGDMTLFQSEFQQYCLDALSYYDISSNNPEKLYHMFILGILFSLKGIYRVKSNREAGLGRNDVMLIPKDLSNRGIIFEFKKVHKKKKETFESKIEEAKYQIEEKKYFHELHSLGVKEVVNIVIAFAGKDVRVVLIGNEE